MKYKSLFFATFILGVSSLVFAATVWPAKKSAKEIDSLLKDEKKELKILKEKIARQEKLISSVGKKEEKLRFFEDFLDHFEFHLNGIHLTGEMQRSEAAHPLVHHDALFLEPGTGCVHESLSAREWVVHGVGGRAGLGRGEHNLGEDCGALGLSAHVVGNHGWAPFAGVQVRFGVCSVETCVDRIGPIELLRGNTDAPVLNGHLDLDLDGVSGWCYRGPGPPSPQFPNAPGERYLQPTFNGTF